MSVELKNWKELCKEKDKRIKELEGKFDLIVERLEYYSVWKELLIYDLTHREREIIKKVIEIVKQV